MQHVLFTGTKNKLTYQGIIDLVTFFLYFLFANGYSLGGGFLFQ